MNIQSVDAYMPSDFCMSTSMTSSLSAAVHLRIFGSAFTTDLIYFLMSSICPLSSCKEMEWKVKGSKTRLMSTSGLLVTHTRRFGMCESTRPLKNDRTFSRGDGIADVFEHSSRPSTI